ncbi:MAG TPA: indole-3-glycerol phosphate synthase TrpC [Chthoniobacterales bacterium]
MAQTILDRILADVRTEVDAAKYRRSAAELRSRAADLPPALSLPGAIEREFGLIAEIKEKSPSVGRMREANIARAAGVYQDSGIVRAVSVLTNFTHFGMSIERLAEVRQIVAKPVLRKDFIIEEYQIREARAFGADAILLMASVLDAARLKGFYDLTRELGMQALFEVHSSEEILALPADAWVVGINSRKFKTTEGFAGNGSDSPRDFSVDLDTFELASQLPARTLRVAESGISAETIGRVTATFHAALVGTSLLRDERGIEAGVRAFEDAIISA